MRELVKALSDLESQLVEMYGVTLNEAMTLCSIGDGTLTASEISELTGLAASHNSKIISSVEKKELIQRSLGEKDKRQMQFILTEKGKTCLVKMKVNRICIPELLKPLFV